MQVFITVSASRWWDIAEATFVGMNFKQIKLVLRVGSDELAIFPFLIKPVNIVSNGFRARCIAVSFFIQIIGLPYYQFQIIKN